jgi:sialic acid synthase SpsE
MLDELKAVDTGKHEVIIKHQLFTVAGENIPLDREIFHKAYEYAKYFGYKTTSSVFDFESMFFLIGYDIPFIKIANNRSLDGLIKEIPENIPLYISVDNEVSYFIKSQRVNTTVMCCVSEYPCEAHRYSEIFRDTLLKKAISDHTTNWDLFNKYNPQIIEVHYKLPCSTGLDSGEFARTPEQLSQIL